MRNLDDIAGFTGEDGAHVYELAGRSSGLVSHSVAVILHPAGTASRGHYHTIADEVYFVESGQGHVTVDGVRSEVDAGDVITIGPGQTHKVEAVTDLTLFVTCAPAYEVGEVVWDE